MSEMPLMFSATWWEIIIGGIATLAIYSFLYRENPFYRLFEHIYIGVATGLGISTFIKTFIIPQAIKPILGLDRIPFPDGTYPEPYNGYLLLYLIPIAFGGLYYFIYSARHGWLAQLVIGFSLGIGGGLAFEGLFNEMLPQIKDSFKPLIVAGASGFDLWESFWNCLFVFILFSSACYFFFTFRRKPGGTIERASVAGRWMLMGCFGAFFGATIMARMALLVERLQFLIEKFFPSILHALF